MIKNKLSEIKSIQKEAVFKNHSFYKMIQQQLQLIQLLIQIL